MQGEHPKVAIGGINIEIISHSDKELYFPDNYHRFATDEKAEAFLHVWDCDAPHLLLEEKGFSSSSITAYRSDQGFIILFHMPGMTGTPPGTVVKISPHLKSVDVYAKSPRNQQYFHPLTRLLFRFVIVSILSWGLGVMVHASGINDNGGGMLFAGVSGAGKSTLAALWKDRGTILSEDAVIVRKREERFWVYGTPLVSDFQLSSQDMCPLEGIYFIEHAQINTLVQEKCSLSDMLPHTFCPAWDVSGMQFTMDFLSKLAKKIPCYKLGFAPDERVVDFVRKVNKLRVSYPEKRHSLTRC